MLIHVALGLTVVVLVVGAFLAGTDLGRPQRPLESAGSSVDSAAAFLDTAAAPAADEDQACHGPAVAEVTVSGETWKAQTFVAGRSGWLTSVQLSGVTRGGTTRVALVVELPACGDPAAVAPPIAIAEATEGERFDFDPPPAILAGRTYALAVSNEDGVFAWRYAGTADCYGRGTTYTSLDGGVSWSEDIVDFLFATYVEGFGAAMPTFPPPSPSPVPPTRTPLPPPPPTPAVQPRAARDALARIPEREPALDQRTVFVISLPTGTSDGAHVYALSAALSRLLAEASSPHGYEDPGARPALGYSIYADRAFVETELPPRCGGTYDLGTLYAKYGLCELIDRGEVDEVWFWEGGLGGYPEWATNGPEWSNTGGTRLPACGRQHALMVLHNARDLDVALHSFGHRIENTMLTYFPCDFATRTTPWEGYRWCPEAASDVDAFVARAGPHNGHVAACGDVHFPPNIPVGDRGDYQYDSPASALSFCESWTRDGSAEPKSITCERWGCDQLGYMLWWMQNLPGEGTTARRPDGEPMPSWWPYLFGDPGLREREPDERVRGRLYVPKAENGPRGAVE